VLASALDRVDKRSFALLERSQRNEITEHTVYRRLGKGISNGTNRATLERIAEEELKHYNFFRELTGRDIPPSRIKVLIFVVIARLFGLTFGLKLMERGEEDAQKTYGELLGDFPGIEAIISDEHEHETELLDLLDEERLKYVGSMVLGLSDALVELTGTLAGLSLALGNTALVAMTGLITGVAASLSMGASEYLSIKSEANEREPLRASLYTGLAYVVTVLFLIFPYLLLSRVFVALGITIINALIVIFIFTFYISIAKDLSFRRRFVEMAGISLAVTSVTFLIGYLIRVFLQVEV